MKIITQFKIIKLFSKVDKEILKFLENFNLTVNIFQKLMHKNAIKIYERVIFQRFLKNVWCFLPKKWCFFRFLGGVLGWCFWALGWCFGPMMFWPHCSLTKICILYGLRGSSYLFNPPCPLPPPGAPAAAAAAE